mgnify:FL=1
MNQNNNAHNNYEQDRNNIFKHTHNKYITRIYETWETVIDGISHKMNSNISPGECIFIHRLMMKYKPINVLEVGLANGMSTMIILNALNIIGGKILYSIDPFQKTQWNSIGLYNVSQTKGDVEHVLVEKMSDVAFDEFSDDMFDMCLIDGPHDKKNVMSDINNTKRILKVGGIMILDDILHKGVREAITEVLKYDKNYIHNVISNAINYRAIIERNYDI